MRNLGSLDINLIARLIFALLPHKPPYTIAIDRTNWKFSQTNINVLVLAVVYRGNSHTKERIEILNHFIGLFGKESIKYLVADREFVGEHWIDYLNLNSIEYHIRIRENFLVLNPKTGIEIKASWLLSDFKIESNKVTILDLLRE